MAASGRLPRLPVKTSGRGLGTVKNPNFAGSSPRPVKTEHILSRAGGKPGTILMGSPTPC